MTLSAYINTIILYCQHNIPTNKETNCIMRVGEQFYSNICFNVISIEEILVTRSQ